MVYKQNTIQSCLSTCIQFVLGIKPNKKEDNILFQGLKLYRNDFALGHLDYVSRNFNRKINYFIESKPFVRLLKRINTSKNVRIFCKEINNELIALKVKEGPIIVYLDKFYLTKFGLSKVHAPHFVVVTKKINEKYKILDPWDGKKKIIHKDVLMIAIRSLWDYLWYSTALIQIEK